MHECSSCPEGATTLSTASTEVSDCVAAPGHYGNITFGFPQCAAGTYSALPAMQTCTPCASGATGAVGAKSSSECGCKQIGYTNRENKQTYIITVSQFAFYIDGERRPPIKLYSPGIYTFDQSDNSNNNHLFTIKDGLGRTYQTGLFYHGIPGQPGAYTSLTMLKSVQASLHYVCAAHGNFMGNTLNLSDEVVCSCQAGYGRDVNKATCSYCPANYYCPGGDLPAQSCPNSSISLPGSAQKSNCTCVAGYTGPDGGPCQACANAEWKAVNGSSACVKCFPNSTSALASTSVNACMCKSGFTGPNGGSCVACQTGFYKEGLGDIQCSKCPANTTTIQVASDEYADCLCESGFESLSTNSSICVACPQGKYKEKPGLPQSQVCAFLILNKLLVCAGMKTRSMIFRL